jgi:hypothetical protein
MAATETMAKGTMAKIAVGERNRLMRLLFGAAAAAALTAAGCSSDASTQSSSMQSSSSTTAAAAVSSIATSPTPVVSASSDPAASAVEPASTTAAVVQPGVTTLDATTTAPAPPPAATATPTPVDGAALLQTAMAGTAVGYHYHAIVTIAGAVAIEVDGDRVGDGTRLGVVRDGVAVQYVITPAGTWVQPDGGDWDQLDTPPATSDPILALQVPLAVNVDSTDGESVHLTVSVTAASLGLAGDAVVPLAVVITAGALAEVIYSTSIDGQPAMIDTFVGPALDPSPVVPPI